MFTSRGDDRSVQRNWRTSSRASAELAVARAHGGRSPIVVVSAVDRCRAVDGRATGGLGTSAARTPLSATPDTPTRRRSRWTRRPPQPPDRPQRARTTRSRGEHHVLGDAEGDREDHHRAGRSAPGRRAGLQPVTGPGRDHHRLGRTGGSRADTAWRHARRSTRPTRPRCVRLRRRREAVDRPGRDARGPTSPAYAERTDGYEPSTCCSRWSSATASPSSGSSPTTSAGASSTSARSTAGERGAYFICANGARAFVLDLREADLRRDGAALTPDVRLDARTRSRAVDSVMRRAVAKRGRPARSACSATSVSTRRRRSSAGTDSPWVSSCSMATAPPGAAGRPPG